MTTRIDLHPLAVRVWHWSNALCFIVLIVTGIQIRYQPASFVTFKTAVEIHNAVAFALIASYLLWAGWHLWTGKITLYLPRLSKAYVQAAIRQARYYGLGMMLGEKNPHHMTADNKFNPMQQVTYLGLMTTLVPVQILSGILLWDPDRFNAVILALGGIKLVATVHMILSIFFVAFIIGHIYLATLGHTPLAHIKAMFTGYEELHDDEEGEGHDPGSATGSVHSRS